MRITMFTLAVLAAFTANDLPSEEPQRSAIVPSPPVYQPAPLPQPSPIVPPADSALPPVYRPAPPQPSPIPPTAFGPHQQAPPNYSPWHTQGSIPQARTPLRHVKYKPAQPSTPEAQKLLHLREAVRHLEAAGLKTEAKQIHAQIEKLQKSELRKQLKHKEHQLKKLQEEISRLRVQVDGPYPARPTSYRPQAWPPQAYYLRDDIEFFPAGPLDGWLKQILRVDRPKQQPPKKDNEQSQVMIRMKVLSVSPEKLQELRIDFATLAGSKESREHKITQVGADVLSSNQSATVAVVCEAPDEVKWIFYELDHQIAKSVADRLHEKKIKVVNPDRVRAWLHENGEWDEVAEVGRSLGVTHVIHIDLQRFTLFEEDSGTLFRGRSEGMVTVFEMDKTGKGELIFSKDLKSVFPSQSPIDTSKIAYSKFKRQYLSNFADEVCRLYCEKRGSTASHATIVDDTKKLEKLLAQLQEKKVVKVVADPTLVTTSGRPASFRSGGEVPIPVPQADGKLSIEYREIGIGLEVVSTVLDDNRIRLEVAPEIGAIDHANAVQIGEFKVPGITTSRVNTEVELKSGQTLVINGLRKADEQIVILITPELVKPPKPEQKPSVTGYKEPRPINFEYRFELPLKFRNHQR